jgi:hypothetical protein
VVAEMTRLVAIGAVIGFAATIIGLSLWDRGSMSAEGPAPDAGSGLIINPRLMRGVQIGAPAVDSKVIYSPRPTSLTESSDAGPP